MSKNNSDNEPIEMFRIDQEGPGIGFMGSDDAEKKEGPVAVMDSSDRPNYDEYVEHGDFVDEIAKAKAEAEDKAEEAGFLARISESKKTEEEEDAAKYYAQLSEGNKTLEEIKEKITDTQFFKLVGIKRGLYGMSLKFISRGNEYRDKVLGIVDKLLAGRAGVPVDRHALVEKVFKTVNDHSEETDRENKLARPKTDPSVEAKKSWRIFR